MAGGGPANDTQIVVQWSLSDAKDLRSYFAAEEAISEAAGDLYFEDGNDVGQGAFNVYLYSARVDATVAQLVAMGKAGKIPADFRIGVAVYKDAAHTDWTYRAAYPAGLKAFSLNGVRGAER
jgi:hypothetical protein